MQKREKWISYFDEAHKLLRDFSKPFCKKSRDFSRWTVLPLGTIPSSRNLERAAEPLELTASRWCWVCMAAAITEAATCCRPAAVSFTSWIRQTAHHRIIRPRRSISIICSSSRRSLRSSSCPACTRLYRRRRRTSPLQRLPASHQPRRAYNKVYNLEMRSRGSRMIRSMRSRQVTFESFTKTSKIFFT